MATLVLVRHAKADRPPGLADIDRDLSTRGERDAALVGAFLAGAIPPPGVLLSSPARRARR
ncbi:MAG TPA: histidine phosphatase family protein, partial [Actinobacteria bacterium]|nr:histidine phosphatase family protein [Actinomycetota bacterium]